MIKTKLWISLTAGTVLALGLGSAALATDLTDTNGDQDPGAPAHASNATLPDKASSVAKAVLAALTAGTSPSTVASKDNDTNAKTDTDETKDTDTDNETDKGPSGATGAKGGWGCGDSNHTHTGPSGRPSASMPPGCTKSQ